MPRVHFVKKARQKHGDIKKGESYYWWKFRRGGKRTSKTPPKPSQLTQSEFWGTVLAQSERDTPDFDDLASTRDEIVSELENLRDEIESRKSNVEDAFPNGSPVIEMLEGGTRHSMSALARWATSIASRRLTKRRARRKTKPMTPKRSA